VQLVANARSIENRFGRRASAQRNFDMGYIIAPRMTGSHGEINSTGGEND